MSFAPTYRNARATPNARKAVLGISVLFLGAAFWSVGVYLLTDQGSRTYYQLVVALFALYLWVECRVFLTRTDIFGLLSPPLLASVFHFFLAYVLPSAATPLDPWIMSRFSQFLVSDADQELIVAQLVMMLAAFCMWRGYYLGTHAAAPLRARLSRLKALRKNLYPSFLPVIGLQVVFFVLVSVAVGLGVFGIASSEEARNANVEILEFLNIALAGGALSLFLLLTSYYRRREAGRASGIFRACCFALVGVHVMIGAISGFKSQVVMPFVMLAMARFVATHRTPVAHVVMGGAALLAAYFVVEPYRAYLARNFMSGMSGIGTLAEAITEASKQSELTVESSVPLGSQIISRFDLLGMSAVGIAFGDRVGIDPVFAQKLAESIYLAPVLAYIPRVLWPGKQSYQTGLWFSQVVLGNTEDAGTSVGMGPVTYLYLFGGYIAVGIGFLLIGWLQAVIFEGFARSGAGGLIVYLSVIATLVMIPSDVGPALTGLLRMLPIAILAQYILLNPDRDRLPMS